MQVCQRMRENVCARQGERERERERENEKEIEREGEGEGERREFCIRENVGEFVLFVFLFDSPQENWNSVKLLSLVSSCWQ